MTLYLVGLGPSPELSDLTRRGQQVLLACDKVYLDTATAAGAETRQTSLKTLYGIQAQLLGPLDTVARSVLLRQGSASAVAFAVAGDALVATPYRHLLQEGEATGVKVVVVPGLSMASVAASLSGLDGSLTQTLVVAEPDHLTAKERQLLSDNLEKGNSTVILAAGRRNEPTPQQWNALVMLVERDFAARVKICTVDGGGTALVAGPT